MSKRLLMLEKLIAEGSRDPFVRYARALELRSEGQLEAALGALGEVEELHPQYVPTFLMAGQIALALGQIETARSWLERGLEAARVARDEHARSELQSALEGITRAV